MDELEQAIASEVNRNPYTTFLEVLQVVQNRGFQVWDILTEKASSITAHAVANILKEGDYY
ncbi:MAG: hypothetical protein ACLFSY_07835 [Desulfonatronovibrionaceae bacterium]